MMNRCRLFTLILRPTLAGLCIAVASLATVSGASARVPSRVIEGNPGQSGWSHSQPLRLSQAQTDGELLMFGDSGDRVADLQNRLADLGFYNGPISGYFGEQTEAAIFDFQESQGLAADGIVGAGTWNVLNGAGSGGSNADDGLLIVGDVGPEVSALQRRLIDLGYYDGGVDGVYGQQTESAILAFQRSAGLNPDGIVGSDTRIALDQATPSNSPAPAPEPAPAP
ncbi:peptidoglycan-binding domain-containing protein, partial [Vacuolonema iberomarrocanum]|uniref:peptidoglycan-binding domain-containing protein n=1 Tax=Vacuolonema iberomarrocanum TaxID=3454632 RepID=UPI001A007E9D|nr:peptidoglycan-binding protein [filamentous cyanobacterium LEGE 07170]